MIHKSRSILAKIAAVAAALLLVCAPARAQMGMGMGGGDMSQYMTSISKKSLDSYARLVGMDNDQKDAAMALHEGYRSSFKQLRADIQKTMKDMMEKVQESGDFMSMGKEMTKTGKDMTDKLETLEKGFLEDIKALLNDRQKESWPRVERMRRRENIMRFNFMSGQSADIFRLLDTMSIKYDATPELSQELERYELELDKPVKAFETWGKDQQDKQVKAMEDGDMTKMMAGWQDTLKDMAEYGKKMRDVNRQYARTVQPLLPQDKQARFDLEFKKKSFPRVYRDGYAAKAIAAAEKFDDLDAAQAEAISGLKAAYERDLAVANRTWAAAVEAKEEKHGGAIGAMMTGMMGGNRDAKDEVSEARQARRDLDDKTGERLRSILREDQRNKLPADKPDPNEKQGMDFGFFEMPEPDEDE
jgi:hypothetical protein